MREPFGRLDTAPDLHRRLLSYCRLRPGDVWQDPIAGHRVGVLDATSAADVAGLVSDDAPHGQPAEDGLVSLVVNDPPYNLRLARARSSALDRQDLETYLRFSAQWLGAVEQVLASDAHLYVWIGADVTHGFQPLPDFMLLMRAHVALTPRNLITLRNQRGYGTQKNWMWVRQELLHYVKGDPPFQVVYTDIPKSLRGYYKEVQGRRTENVERSRASTIRPGNVWIDIQQVFYRLEENVPGAYAQKPLRAIERIIATSSEPGATVLDCFAHSGTSLIAGERLGRRVFTFDIDPVFAELTIRRLERYRDTGKTGWQCHNPFPEMLTG